MRRPFSFQGRVPYIYRELPATPGAVAVYSLLPICTAQVMTKFSFSNRIAWNSELNRLSGLLERLRREGKEILDLTGSNPTKAGFLFPPETLREGLIQPGITDYDPHPRGLQVTREAIAVYYADHGIAVNPESIYCTAGTSEAYSMLFKLIGDPGDEILVPVPSYPLFEYLVSFEALHPVPFHLRYFDGKGWRVDRGSVETACSNRTRGLIIVNPNNPTGSYLAAEDREFLAAFCRQRDMALIVDEVFHDYCFLDEQPPSVLEQESPCLLFALNGFSKTLCLPQVKLSWFVVSGPPDVKHEARLWLDILHDSYLSVSTPVQLAAPVLLRRREIIQEAVRRRCRENLSCIRTAMEPFDWIEVFPVEGGWSAVLGTPLIDDGEEFALRLLEHRHVLVHPGYLYDFPDDLYLVVSLLPAVETFRAGIKRLAEAFADL